MVKILVLTALLLSSPVFAVDSGDAGGRDDPPAPSIAQRLGTAREAIRSGEWRKALAELQLAYREEPRNADVHNLLGYSYRKQPSPNLARAIEHYRTALRLNPGHKGAHEYIGEAYLMERKPELAEQHLAELERLCGNRSCEEYADLAKALADYKAAAK
jgi:Flp pilus assembly protein TadD